LQESSVRYLLFTQQHAKAIPTPELLTAFWNGSMPGLRYLPEASNRDAGVYVAE
jgi:hypothetical protein